MTNQQDLYAGRSTNDEFDSDMRARRAREERERDEALARVEAHAQRRWLQCAEGLILSQYPGTKFTSRDIELKMKRSFSHIQTHEPRAMGAVIRNLAVKGQIARTQERKRTGSHGRDQTVWLRVSPGTGHRSLENERDRRLRADERGRLAEGVRRCGLVTAERIAVAMESGECICGGEEHGGGNHLPWCFAAYGSDLR